MSSGRETVRGTFASPTFSMIANRGVGVVAVVSVLIFATVSLQAALIGAVAFALYFYVAYDLLYDRASKRFDLGTTGDFVFRTVALLGGAFALPFLLVRSPGQGTALAGFMGTIEAPLGIALAAAGVLFAFEGVEMLRKRLRVGAATPYVGQDVDGGVVAFQGTAERRGEAGPDEVRTDGGRPDDDEPRIMTDGGRPVQQGSFEGTEFEPIETADEGEENDVSPFDPGPSPFDGEDENESARGNAVVERAEPERRRPEHERSETESPAHAGERVEPTGRETDVDIDPSEFEGEPVVVDGNTEQVVATRSDCTVSKWRKAVVKWLVKSFAKEHGVDLRQDPEALSRMASVADRAREDLAERPETEVLLPFIAEIKGHSLHIRRRLVAVDENGRPRSEAPFGSAAKKASSKPRSTRSTETEPRTDEASASSGPAAETVARTEPSTGTETPAEPSVEDDPEPSVEAEPTETEAVEETVTETEAVEETVTETEDAEEPTTETEDTEEPTTETDEAEETTESDVEDPVALESPQSGKQRVAFHQRRRSKLARPRVLDVLPVDGESINEALPDELAVGERLPGVPGLDRVPDRVSVPKFPDLYEDRPDQPGVRTLVTEDSGGVPFDVDTFGTVRVDPTDADLLMTPDASGTDGPGFWYERGVEPGDRITVIGTPSDADGDVDMAVDDVGGDLIVSDGEVDELKSRLTKGGALRLGGGLAALSVGSSMAMPGLGVVGLITSVGLPAAVVAGAGYAVKTRVAPSDDADADEESDEPNRLVRWAADRVRSVERNDDGGIRTAHWRFLSELTDAVERRRD